MFFHDYAETQDFTKITFRNSFVPKAADRKAWEGIPAAYRAQMQKNAENALTKPWPLLLATEYMAFEREGDRKAQQTPHSARRHKLAALVLGEASARTGQFLDEIINGVWLLCEESYWGVSAHRFGGHNMLPDTENPYIDLHAGETAQLLAWTLHIIGDELGAVAPEVPRRLEVELKRRIRDPFLTREDFWWMGNGTRKVNNWTPWIISNVLTVFLLTETCRFRMAKAVQKSLNSLDVFLQTYGEDGGCDEGISYWSRAGASLFESLYLLHKATDGEIDFFDRQIIRNMALYVPRMHIAAEYFVNFADGGAKSRPNGRLLHRFGRAIGDANVMAAGEALDTPPLSRGLMQILPSLFDEGNYQGGGVMPVFRDTYLESLQVFAAREEENSTNGLYIAAKGGDNAENHNHNDVGSFVLYSDGAPVMIDAGVGTYTKKTFSSQRYSLWYMQSGWHNTPEINGHMQQNGAEFTAENAVYIANDDQAVFSCDIAKAYPAAAGIANAKRSFALTRGEKPGLAVEDSFVFTKEGNQIRLCFLLAQKPSLGAGEVILHGENGRDVKMTFDEDLSLAVEEKVIGAEDPGLQSVWGDKVFRLLLSGQTEGNTLATKIVFAQIGEKICVG